MRRSFHLAAPLALLALTALAGPVMAGGLAVVDPAAG